MPLAVEIAIRTVLIFVWVLVLFRLSGKRHLGQMNVYDLAMVMAVANGIQNAITKGSGELTVGVTSSITLLSLGWLLSRLSTRSARVQAILHGSPTVLVNDGHAEPAALKRECVSMEEIDKALRAVGLSDVSEARMVVLEVDGTLSVVPR